MKTYIISWTECVDCQAAVRAEDAAEAVAKARASIMGGEDIAETRGKSFCEEFQCIDEEDDDED